MALEEKIEFGDAAQMISQDDAFKKVEGKDLVRLDLACGERKEEGWTGVDLNRKGKDIINHDLDIYPWPFEDNSVYEIKCDHYVEHIPGQYGLVHFMNEVYRILMPLGTIKIQSPYYTSMRAWQDPTHCRAITDLTFGYFDKSVQKINRIDHYFGDADFEVLTMKHFVNDEWESRGDEARIWAVRHYFNVVDDIMFVLRKRIKTEE